jgi:hypothetical protein
LRPFFLPRREVTPLGEKRAAATGKAHPMRLSLAQL